MMEEKDKSMIKREADYLIIPINMTLEEINNYRHTPRILKKALGLYENMDISLYEALMTKPYLMPILVLADGMMEQNKGDWSIKVDNGMEIKVNSEIRINLYGLESYFYETKEMDDGEKYIIAGVATIQNANVPDWRVVLCKSDGIIFRDKKLEGMIQGQKIQDAKIKKKDVLKAYSKVIGEEEKNWLSLLENFLEKSGL